MKEITLHISTGVHLTSGQFGAIDTRAHRAFATMRENLYLDEGLNGNARVGALDILQREYIDKGRDVHDPRSITGEMLDEFRQAAGGVIDKLPDWKVRAIIIFATQRVREFGNAINLDRARYKWAKVVYDRRCEDPLCKLLNGKFFRVKIAVRVLGEIAALPMNDQGFFVRELLKTSHTETFLASLHSAIRSDIVPDSFTQKGFGIPPLHETCGCRAEGVDKEEVENMDTNQNREVTAENPQATKMSGWTLLAIVGGIALLTSLFVAGVMVNLSSDKPAATVASTPTPKSKINKSAEAQAMRQELIDKTKRMGIVDRIEPGQVVHVYVTALFFGIKRDNQSAIMDAIYQNNYSDDSQVMGIYDAKNGDKLGRYSQLGGLDVKP